MGVQDRTLKLYTDVMDYLEEVDPDIEWAGLPRRKVMADLAHYCTSSCCMRRGGKQHWPLLMPSSRESHFLRLLPATSLIPAKSLLPVTSLSPARQQAALPALMFHRRRRQMLTTQASSNSPPPPPNPHPSTSASKEFRPLLVSVTILFLYFKMSISFIFIIFCILKCLFYLHKSKFTFRCR